MKSIFTGLFFFLGLLIASTVFASSALATDYYFSPSGNDSSNGTSTSTPWKTVSKINNVDLNAGDHVYFQSGQTFATSSAINLVNGDSGTAVSPVAFTTYGGSSPATINVTSSGSNGIYGYNVSGISIANLIITGQGSPTGDTIVGIQFYSDGKSGTQTYVHIDSVDVSRFGRGIVIGSANNAVISDVRVTNASVHDNKYDGMLTYSQSSPTITNVYVGHSRFYNNTGVPGLNKNSGSGLIMGGVDGGVLEYSTAYNNGSLADANEGPVGLWAYQAKNLIFQFNESYGNKTGGPADGGGFDFDGGVSNSIMQYNYAHDNDGAGYGFYQYSPAGPWTNNIIRYNIGQNNARKNGYGEVTFWNNYTGINNAQFYGNTFYTSPTSSLKPAIVTFFTANAAPGLVMRNNIFYTTGDSPFVYDPYGQSNSTYQANDYYNASGKFNMKWNNTNYISYVNWQTSTNQEKLNGANVGFNVNPLLTNPGNGGTIGDTALLTGLTAYKLQAGSPMINAGLNLTSLFGTNVGTRDYYGSTIPQGTGFDIGAHEFGGVSSTPAPTATAPSTPGTCDDADINQDGTVDAQDTTILLADFLKTTLANHRSDVNRNGIADLTDYGIVAKYYLQTCP